MRFGSLCTGAGGFDLGLEAAGMVPVFQCEQDAACNRVLKHRWSDVKRTEDVNDDATEDALRRSGPDLVCFGFPCQDLSVAGRREGLAGERSSLFFRCSGLAHASGARWVLIENVPGLLSSNKRRDMGIVLGTLGDLGYRWAYRMLDAQYDGVAQRRRRVFIVGRLGNGPDPAEILFESESVSWDPPSSREAGAGVSALTSNGVGTCGPDDNQGQAGHLIAYQCHGSNVGPAGTLRQANGSGGVPFLSHPITARPYADNAAQEDRLIPETAWCLQERDAKGPDSDTKEGHLIPVSYRTSGNCGVTEQGDRTAALNCSTDPTQNVLQTTFGVRRLTPKECERLQGWPDDWTRWGAGDDGERVEISDTARYRMCGNGVAAPVAAWIARRILRAEQQFNSTDERGESPGARAERS
ncbi:DNA cytosine methyltransferase [Stratiformator vulcanicus]|uniref:Cytosine-specific methyltransferase n=1 Tax=Stratiformator vulcanicus TaxID=2527980 RepID=A0A517R7B9_9PLAN|nr:DNA cytosine methyltransferase [Stratiformator vulcanicus]QDT39752.1 putative BsuMI modification methylase subunit YdiP [Stratiformator vulcanicus]